MSETETAIETPAAAPADVGCRHLHRCQNCGLIWGHGNMMEADLTAHTCPKCGRAEWRIFTGLQAPTAPQKKGIDWGLIVLCLCVAAAAVIVFLEQRRRRLA